MDNRKFKIIFIFITCMFLCGSVFSADNKTNPSSTRMAMMSFANFSGNYRAVEFVMPLLMEKVNEKFGHVYSPSEVRNVLRKYRIRSFGKISKTDALKIKKELNINYLILGSIDFFNQNEPLEVGLSVRVLDIITMEIVYADSYSATGIDYLKIFGFGRINGLDKLSQKVIDNLFNNISIEKFKSSREKNYPKVAIIEFDNSSRIRDAGKIVSNQLISLLFNNGYEIIEPGIIDKLLLNNQIILRGEIDNITRTNIHKAFDADLILTGIIDKYKLARGTNGEISSEAELSIRILDASNKKILFIEDVYKNGEDFEKFFKVGRYHSLGKLSNKIIKDALDKFEKRKG